MDLDDSGSTPLRTRFMKPVCRARRVEIMDGIQGDRGHCRLGDSAELLRGAFEKGLGTRRLGEGRAMCWNSGRVNLGSY